MLGEAEVPQFTPAHVEYLERQFLTYLGDDIEYTLPNIAMKQGQQKVVSHIKALVARQAKQRT